MYRTPIYAVAAVLILCSAVASAATFIVPSDAELARKSQAVILGTVIDVASVANEQGGIETTTTVRVDDVLKGSIRKLETVQITELGGVLANRALVIPGTPTFSVGEQVLVFLDRNRRGGWSTTDLALGKFDFVATGPNARGLIRRELHSEAATDTRGRAHQERARDEQKFLNYLRGLEHGKPGPADYFLQSSPVDRRIPRFKLASSSAEVLDALWRGEMTAEDIQLVQSTTYPPSAYVTTVGSSSMPTRPVRWSLFDGSAPQTVSFRSYGTQNGQTDSLGSAQRGLAAWTNDSGSSVNYAYAGTTTSTLGLNGSDKINSIVFNDPNGQITGSFTGSGTVAIGGYYVTSTTNSFKGETFYTIFEGDLVVQDGVVLSTTKFDEAMTHELGHTLGFRHSNTSTAPSTSAAVMNSVLSGSYGTNLQSWDLSAVRTVYGSGTATGTDTGTSTGTTGGTSSSCTVPTITSQTGALRVRKGSYATISVTASGTTPFTYRWYEGQLGGSSRLLYSGSASSRRYYSSTAKTRYFWVDVINSCGSRRSQQMSITWY